MRLSRWVAGFVFHCVKNRNPPPTLLLLRPERIPSFVRLSRWVAGFVFHCVKNRNPSPTLLLLRSERIPSAVISFVRLSRWVAGFVFHCVKNRNPPPTLQPGIFLCAYVIGGPMSWAASLWLASPALLQAKALPIQCLQIGSRQF